MKHPLFPAIDAYGRITLTSKVMAALFVIFIPTLAAGVAGWLACTGRVTRLDLGILLVSYVLTGLGITVGYHRLFTHRSFRTYRPIRWALALLGSTAAEGAPILWASQHRAHHADSDGATDPHSPKWLGLWHAHYGHIFQPVERIEPERFCPDLMRDPFLIWLEKYSWIGVVLGLVLPAAAGWAIGGTWQAAATAFLWGGWVRLFFITHATGSINSICHRFGSSPFETGDQSRNVWWLMPLSLGESWHNGHHAFPSSAKHGLRLLEIDPSWCVIWLMEKAGLAYGVVRIPAERIALKKLD